MKQAGLAAVVTAGLCLPRLLRWTDRPGQLWVIWLILLWSMFILWDFAFAWQEKYGGTRVLVWPVPRLELGIATVCGVVAALLVGAFLDPQLRVSRPEEYPDTVKSWLAMMLFVVSFESLFLCFAPFAFFVRLVQRVDWSVGLTVLFTLFVMFLKMSTSSETTPVDLVLKLLVFRAGAACLAVWLYRRGGAVLVWWWVFLVQLRLLVGVLAD